MSGDNNVRFEWHPIKNIQILDKNPRKIDDEEFAKLIEDIKQDPAFLKQRPPLLNYVDGVYYCYAGTQRVRAAESIGLTHLWCFVENNLPEELQDERMVKDNLHRGEWDEDKLFQLTIPVNVMADFGFKDFEVTIFNDLVPDEPKDLVAPYKEAPPTMKLTFTDIKQMEQFEVKLKDIIHMNEKFSSIIYSVSSGEI